MHNQFEQLKSVVPKLADHEKASKLVIVNKSTDYCKVLASLDAKLKKEQKKKKLQALQETYTRGVRLSSGRISVLHSRHRDY